MELIYYRHNKNSRVNHLNKRSLNFYELTILFQGSIRYKINHQELLLNSHDILFLPPNSIRERYKSKEPVELISFNFLSDEPIDLPSHLSNISLQLISTLSVCIDRLYNSSTDTLNRQIKHLLSCIIEDIKMQLQENQNHPLPNEIKKYLIRNIKNHVTLEDVGKAMFYSPLYCNLIFKKETGVPIITFFNSLKIEESKKLLLSDELSLKEIAFSLGFDDYNYFARTFKKYTGKTPLEYKKSIFN